MKILEQICQAFHGVLTDTPSSKGGCLASTLLCLSEVFQANEGRS